jgi:hypothetical protein
VIKETPLPEPKEIPSIHIEEELDDDQKTLDGLEDLRDFEIDENSVNVYEADQELETPQRQESDKELARKSSDPENDQIIYYGDSDNENCEDFPLNEPVFTSQEEQRIAHLLKKVTIFGILC